MKISSLIRFGALLLSFLLLYGCNLSRPSENQIQMGVERLYVNQTVNPDCVARGNDINEVFSVIKREEIKALWDSDYFRLTPIDDLYKVYDYLHGTLLSNLTPSSLVLCTESWTNRNNYDYHFFPDGSYKVVKTVKNKNLFKFYVKPTSTSYYLIRLRTLNGHTVVNSIQQVTANDRGKPYGLLYFEIDPEGKWVLTDTDWVSTM